MKQRHLQRKLDRDGVALEEALDREVMGLVAVLALDDPSDLAVMDARIELLEVEDGADDDIRVVAPALVGRGGLVDEAEPAVLDEAASLLADGVAVNASSPDTQAIPTEY